MPAYIVARVDVTDPVKFKGYQALTPGAIAAHGGRFIARGGDVTTLEGADETRRVVLLEFPDVATAKKFWDSPEYAEAKSKRENRRRLPGLHRRRRVRAGAMTGSDLTIKDVRVTLLTVPYKEQPAFQRTTPSRATSCYAKSRRAAGHVGLGYQLYLREGMRTTKAAIEEMHAPRIVGRDATEWKASGPTSGSRRSPTGAAARRRSASRRSTWRYGTSSVRRPGCRCTGSGAIARPR